MSPFKQVSTLSSSSNLNNSVIRQTENDMAFVLGKRILEPVVKRFSRISDTKSVGERPVYVSMDRVIEMNLSLLGAPFANADEARKYGRCDEKVEFRVPFPLPENASEYFKGFTDVTFGESLGEKTWSYTTSTDVIASALLEKCQHDYPDAAAAAANAAKNDCWDSREAMREFAPLNTIFNYKSSDGRIMLARVCELPCRTRSIIEHGESTLFNRIRPFKEGCQSQRTSWYVKNKCRYP